MTARQAVTKKLEAHSTQLLDQAKELARAAQATTNPSDRGDLTAATRMLKAAADHINLIASCRPEIIDIATTEPIAY